jgi:predicted cupin superfamily sugar epimerase
VTQPLSADEIIRLLSLQLHPEGGHYCETFRDGPGPDGRARSTAIYFLLKAGERSHWHRVDAVEIWHFYVGAPLALNVVKQGQPVETIRLGPDLVGGDRPQAVVPAGAWQAAASLGDCTVAPGFRFEGFELASDPVIDLAIEPNHKA